MTPKIMRQLWSVVETAHSKTLLQLDDASLVQWLVKQTKMHTLLDCKETDFLIDYIQSRLSLIRDIVQERHQYS
jgi:succinate dehydrogenase flavin-adding protein (antitoxin of CptAB toxin-antitoxin module)